MFKIQKLRDQTGTSSDPVILDHSSDDASSDFEIKDNNKRKRGKGILYVIHGRYDSLEEADDELFNLGEWRKARKNHTNDGTKIYYKCKSSKCLARACVLLKDDDNEIVLLKNEAQHEHVEEIKISKPSQDAIIELFENGITKPEQILDSLIKKNNSEKLTKLKIANFLALYKKNRLVSI